MKKRGTKRIGLLDFQEDGARIMVRQEISRKGDILSPYFNQTDLKRHSIVMMETEKYKRVIKSDGICLICGDINFSHFQEHHPYPKELPNFKITLCANCHQELHFYLGRGNSKHMGGR